VAKSRLLIADDQPEILEALRLLLSGENFAVTMVSSPSAVVDHLGAAKWDAVLIDLNYSRGATSGDEGVALIARIRPEHQDLPIIVMTGWGDIDLAVRAMRAGAQSFVQKPWDNRALVQILEREIADGRGARERSAHHGREQQDARLIQRALMPATLPTTERFEIVGAWQPAGTLGGDCYDVFTFTPDVIGISIADVAGKGLPAALVMSSLQAAVRAFAHDSSPPQALCASVNRLLCGQMIAGRFVTMVYLRLDAARARIEYANAGHNPPLLVRAGGNVEALQASGTVLGVFPDATYAGAETALQGGDRLLLYTDGITEARDRHDEEFGQERLAASLARYRHLSARELHAAVMKEVTDFATEGFQDDATLLAVAMR
jgi:sigma-B regulation protein RsbU (phosphoserine phosphatase)